MLEKIWRLLGGSSWQTFKYNYGWSDYVTLFDGWIARCAMAVPIIGYLILFNDFIVTHLSFDLLAKEKTLRFGLGSGARLKLIYFGLLLLGSANILYRVRRPFLMKHGRNEKEYVEHALATFVLDDYIQVHNVIRREGHTTPYGKYYDSEYQDFRDMARGVHGDQPGKENVRSDWSGAKQKYEALLRSMLMDFYFRHQTTRRIALSICLALAISGYALLFIPSVDLFVKVVAISL
jgi:hypothetical protein